MSEFNVLYDVLLLLSLLFFCIRASVKDLFHLSIAAVVTGRNANEARSLVARSFFLSPYSPHVVRQARKKENCLVFFRQMLLEILFGSQTGTAEDVSERFSCMARSTGVQCRVRPLDSVKSIEDLGPYILFIVSTTGDGEEPENMRQFWRLIMRKSLSSVLSHIHYGLIGLGDSTYPKFNFVAKKLSKRLEQLGAQAICDKVLADEQHPHGTHF
jgi:sulfite reductase alpha subunit-like flavoprotein